MVTTSASASARSSTVRKYLPALIASVRALAGDELVGIYAGGSYALGAYEPGRSDLDVAVVLAAPPPQRLKEQFVAELRHESLPCPARGLELVVYTADEVAVPSTAAAFELNVNTGARMAFRVDFEPDPDEAHWFPIDRSILAQHGVALYGPRAGDVVAAISRQELIPLLVESLRRQVSVVERGDDVVLNACRTWMYIKEGVWSSKPAAGEWAAKRAPLAATALRARHAEAALPHEEVQRFVADVLALVDT
jgi:hypothetical protein